MSANLEYIRLTEALRARIADKTGAETYVGLLPPRAGVSVGHVGGSSERDLAGNSYEQPVFQITAKGETTPGALELITKALDAVDGFEADDDVWQITGVSLRRTPAFLGPDGSGFVLYSAAVVCRVFRRGNYVDD